MLGLLTRENKTISGNRESPDKFTRHFGEKQKEKGNRNFEKSKKIRKEGEEKPEEKERKGMYSKIFISRDKWKYLQH